MNAARGVYFFFDPFEARRESGVGLRVVRVGTHALTSGSGSTLRQRLGQHRGGDSGRGNHRGSIFRRLVGQALLEQGGLPQCDSWGIRNDRAKGCEALAIDRRALVASEAPIEQAVTRYIGALPFLCFGVDDDPGPASLRAIALLSNFNRPPLDPPSADWLGHVSDRVLVRGSGLWNQRHVGESYDPLFLDALEDLIQN